MAELPFLVVHGALIWKASVLGAGALGVQATRLLRDRKSSKFVRRAATHYTASATGLEAGPILVRGHLRGGGAQSFEHGVLPVVHQRDAGVYLDIEGERIDFDGDVVVGCGSENRTAYWGVPAGAPVIDEPMAAARAPKRLSLVQANDEVLVGGVLRRAAIGDQSYRESAATWVIEPFPRQGAIGLVAKAHRARAMPVGPVRSTATFGIAAVIALAGMRTCGAIEQGSSGHGEAAIHDMTVAAAMPGTREDALDELDHLYLDQRSPVGLDHAIALRGLRRGCAAAVDLMFDEGRPEQALAAARECKLPEREVDALMLLGRYDEAAAAPGFADSATGDEHALTAIALGRWHDAAAFAPDGCVRQLFDGLARPGSVTADQLGADGSRCALVGVRLLPAGQRAGAASVITTPDVREARLAEQLVDLNSRNTSHAHDDHDFDQAARELIVGDGREPSAFVWTSHPGDLTPMRAVYETYAGHFDRAQEIAGRLIAQATTEAETAEAHYFAALIAMRANRGVIPAGWLDHAELLPEGSVFNDPDLGAPLLIERQITPSLARGAYGLGAAMIGAGAGLADEGRELTLADGMKLIAVLPQIKTHRDEALDFVRALRGDTMDANLGPLRVIRAAAMRRDLARATDDADVAARWQGIIDRQLAALADRDRVLALLVR